jgi:hypothetical protein
MPCFATAFSHARRAWGGLLPALEEAQMKKRVMLAQTVEPPADLSHKFVTMRQLLARYGDRSSTWLSDLMERDAEFPRPIRPGRYRLWSIEQLESWERRQMAAVT